MNAILRAISVAALLGTLAWGQLKVPITYYKLPNGLKVVLSKDATAPIVSVAIYYGIGMRLEARDRTGFAHLFEHMMFAGSKNLSRKQLRNLIEGNGGIFGGSTRFDFTDYWEIVLSNRLEPTLWAEADRMNGLVLNEENLRIEKGIVSNEVKVNVLNRPYGGFPWIDMPQYANKNWHNAHNFYGDLHDIEAATLEDVKSFFKAYYAPNNAALAIVGDFDEGQVKAWVAKYFGALPAQPPGPRPDLTEPRQSEEIHASRVDKIAKHPALAIAYHLPDPRTPEHYAAVLIDVILRQGSDSLLSKELVNKRGYTTTVSGGINLLSDAFDYTGPMLWIANLIHDNSVPAADIVAAIDQVMAQLQDVPVTREQLDRALIQFRSSFYIQLSEYGTLGRAFFIAALALLYDDPGFINRVEGELKKVDPALIQKVAREYFRKTNRTVLTLEVAK